MVSVRYCDRETERAEVNTHIQSPNLKLVLGLGGLLERVYSPCDERELTSGGMEEK